MKKNLLILGGFGFIGRNLAEKLKNQSEIIIFDRSYSPKNTNLKGYKGDFNNLKMLEKVFEKHNIDIIIHCISTTVPAFSNQNIIYDIESNIINTIKLLDLMRKYSVKKIIFPSSGGAIYGLENERKNSERHNINPISSYAITKLTIEKYIKLYKHLYDIDYLILRISNPFGEYHKSEKQGLINVTLRKIVNGEKVTIWGDGKVVKDYIYVQDCVKIIHTLISKKIWNEVINIGSGQGYSTNNILSIIKKITGDFKIERQEAKKSDVSRNILDISKLRSVTDLEFTSIEVGIQNTYNWSKTQI